jgi:hypothetical protein
MLLIHGVRLLFFLAHFDSILESLPGRSTVLASGSWISKKGLSLNLKGAAQAVSCCPQARCAQVLLTWIFVVTSVVCWCHSSQLGTHAEGYGEV